METDLSLNGLGFMLYRDPTSRARSWTRAGEADIPARKQADDVKYGDLPDDIDHPEVWEDWAGGFGDYYRLDNQRNHYHYSENMDARFSRQLIHAQQPQLLPARYGSVNINIDTLIDVPLNSASISNPPAGAGMVLAVGRGIVASFTPTTIYSTPGSMFDVNYEATGGGALGFGHHPAVFGSYTWLPNTNGSGFYRRGHDLTYTLSDCMTARWFEIAAGRMWRTHGRGYVQSVAIGADPLVTANWSATLPLANGQMISDAAGVMADRIFVGFPDGLYQGDATGTFGNIATQLGDAVTSDSVRDVTAFESGQVFGFGPKAFQFIPSDGANSQTTEISPDALGGNKSPVRGRWTCFEGFGEWLYGGLFTGSQSYVMVARNASGGASYVWHPLQKLPHGCKVSRLHVDSISTASSGDTIPQRIWAATEATFGAIGGATAPLYMWPIPYGDANPVNIPTFSANYCGSARIDFGVSNWDMPSTTKVFRSVEVTADNLASGAQWVDVYHTIDGLPRTLLGTATTSPRSTLFFPGLNNVPGQGFARGQALAISLESFTASFGVTPIIRSVVVRGTARPAAADEIEVKIAIGDRVSDRRGNHMRPGATQMAELRTMAQSDQPAQLMDLTGALNWVAVRNPISEVEAYQGGEQNAELIATVKMAVMSFTTNTVVNAGTNQVLAQYTNDQLHAFTNSQLEFF